MPTPPSAPLGALLLEARLAKRWSQVGTAELLGVTRAALWTWETGRATPLDEHLPKICAVLDIPADDLFAALPPDSKLPRVAELLRVSPQQMLEALRQASS